VEKQPAQKEKFVLRSARPHLFSHCFLLDLKFNFIPTVDEFRLGEKRREKSKTCKKSHPGVFYFSREQL